MNLVIISGRSGSGKTIALHALEDYGFYCIDNLPIALLPELEKKFGVHQRNVAISIDSRNLPDNLVEFKDYIQQLNQKASECRIFYLDANEDKLLRRFSETRRKHPLTNNTVSLREAIQQEQKLLVPLANLAGSVIDTTNLSTHDLHKVIRERIAKSTEADHLHLQIQSFGFKFGLPPDADFMFDVRCLPNPYWIPELRRLNGRDQGVANYLSDQNQVREMLNDILSFVQKWIPQFAADDRAYMTIAVGCTGGHHRSVFIAEQLGRQLQNELNSVQIRHRDLN